MWGIDGGDTPFADRTDEQYIELYNTVADADTADTSILDPMDLGIWIIHEDRKSAKVSSIVRASPVH